MSKRVVFKRAHSHPFCRSFVWNLLTSQRRNMNIWLKVKNQHQGPTFRKLQLEDFFFPPCAYILSRYLPGKRNVYECGICFFTSCIIFISEPLHNLEIVFRGWQFWLFYYYILTCKLRRLHSLNMSPGDKIRTQVTKFSPYL